MNQNRKSKVRNEKPKKSKIRKEQIVNEEDEQIHYIEALNILKQPIVINKNNRELEKEINDIKKKFNRGK